jgi:hypothetical protein
VKTPLELRKFGYVMAGAAGAVAGLLWWRSRPAAPWFAAVGVVFLLTALVGPTALRPIERVWMRFADILSAVMTRVILVLTFFLVITPLAVVLRLLGKDPLRLRPDPDAQSFWIPVAPDAPGTRPDKPF